MSENIISVEAWEYYKTRTPLRHPFRNYLRQDFLEEVQEIFGVTLEVDALKLLVGEDGPTTICSVTGEVFQPVWWLDIGNRKFLDNLEEHLRRSSSEFPDADYLSPKKILDETIQEMGYNLLKFGSFYLKKKIILAFSGSPFVWKENLGKYTISGSPLGDAKKLNSQGYWGLPRSGLERIRNYREQRKEQAAKVMELLKSSEEEESE